MSGFIFPDDEELIQAEFEKNIPFALSVAQSAHDPDDPVSALGLDAPDLVADPFTVSYGRNQQVAVTAKRSLRNVTAQLLRSTAGARRPRRSGSGGAASGTATPTTTTTASSAARITAAPGDEVEVWFTGRNTGGGGRSVVDRAVHLHGADGHRRRRAHPRGRGRHRHQPGAGPDQRAVRRRVRRVARGGRLQQRRLRLRHHGPAGAAPPRACSRTTTRSCGRPATTSSCARPARSAARPPRRRSTSSCPCATTSTRAASCSLAGKYDQFAQAANGAYFYNPFQPPECTTPEAYPCLPVLNDFQQYWLGAYVNVSDGGTDADGEPFPLVGVEGAVRGLHR